ncbi:MAG: SWIM zinc finger family protein [Candidatus Eisenbacteria sp.]|nr:SWIM zinc finger family protein [Candidatus Eisenbacteria bacterium]
MRGFRWRPYVPVHVRQQRAARRVDALRKKGKQIAPVEIASRQIARTFWGQAWCQHLEKFSDYANRLPRGRTYVRNGSVCHLEIQEGVVNAMVSGNALYHVTVGMKKLPKKKWRDITHRCAGQIGSLLELLQGRLSDSVMEVVTDRRDGLFPQLGEMSLKCSCPDWATMCKHVAAVLYGVGARLDDQPEMLFLLRGVKHEELVSAGVGLVGKAAQRGAGTGGGRSRRLSGDKISDVFGIEMEVADSDAGGRSAKPGRSPAKGRAKAGRPSVSGGAKAGKLSVDKPKATASARRPRATASVRRPRATVAAKPVRRGGDHCKRGTRRSEVPTPAGKDVGALRRKFAMTQGELAALLGMSVGTVATWERSKGRLRLQARSLAAWLRIAGLTRIGARRRLNRLSR